MTGKLMHAHETNSVVALMAERPTQYPAVTHCVRWPEPRDRETDS